MVNDREDNIWDVKMIVFALNRIIKVIEMDLFVVGELPTKFDWQVSIFWLGCPNHDISAILLSLKVIFYHPSSFSFAEDGLVEDIWKFPKLLTESLGLKVMLKMR